MEEGDEYPLIPPQGRGRSVAHNPSVFLITKARTRFLDSGEKRRRRKTKKNGVGGKREREKL